MRVSLYFTLRKVFTSTSCRFPLAMTESATARDRHVLKNKEKLRSTLSRVSRVILGAMLLVAILSANIPSSVIASGPMCTLACCAGRAPHAAGSCMNGSCHAFLAGHNQKPHIHQTRVRVAEQVCGLSRATKNASRLLFMQMATTEPSLTRS